MNDSTVRRRGFTRALPRAIARAIGHACLPAVLGVVISAGVPAHAAGDGWWVSLGVYASQPAAEQARARIAAPADSLQVVPFERDGRTLYRVTSGPFADASALRSGLRAARSRVPGAFALPVAGVALEAQPAARVQLAGTELPPATAPDAMLAVETAGDRHAPAAAAQVTAPAHTERRPALAPAEDNGLAGLRLDPATERLLRDDAALQRELERLSRGLPKGLGNEIQAAQGQGVSLQEVHARTMVGPQSPSTPPPGYQLHRLHRDDVPAQASDEDDE